MSQLGYMMMALGVSGYDGHEGIKKGGTHEPPHYNNQHLYITTDDEIKEGD